MKSTVFILAGLGSIAAARPQFFQNVPASMILHTAAPQVTASGIFLAAAATVTSPKWVNTTTSSSSMAQQTFYVDVGALDEVNDTTVIKRANDITVGGAKDTTVENDNDTTDNEVNDTTVYRFMPNNIKANVGDLVLFNMLGSSHSVTQSTFDQPCVEAGPFNTGLQPNPSNSSGRIIMPYVVPVSTPLWFFCGQTEPVDHCGTGMVFAINPESQAQMEEFIEMAIAQNGTSNPESQEQMEEFIEMAIAQNATGTTSAYGSASTTTSSSASGTTVTTSGTTSTASVTASAASGTTIATSVTTSAASGTTITTSGTTSTAPWTTSAAS